MPCQRAGREKHGRVRKLEHLKEHKYRKDKLFKVYMQLQALLIQLPSDFI